MSNNDSSKLPQNTETLSIWCLMLPITLIFVAFRLVPTNFTKSERSKGFSKVPTLPKPCVDLGNSNGYIS